MHGSVQALERATGWKGKDVLFVGDNLRVDLVEARRWHGWHTACVINELNHEVSVQGSPVFNELHFLRSTVRHLIVDLQDRHEGDDVLDGPRQKLMSNLLTALESELHKVNSEMSSLFNPNFGSIFRSDGHLSSFAFAVRRYADIYMHEVNHMLRYDPNHRFYPTNAMSMVSSDSSVFINGRDHCFKQNDYATASLGP